MTPDDLMQVFALLADLRRQVLALTAERDQLAHRLTLATGEIRADGDDLATAARQLADAFP